jgi:hypothetical protein
MKVVWKYEIPVQDHFALSMPAGAQILSVQTQHASPVLWALVNPDLPRDTVHFRLAGTGHPLPEGNLQFVATFQVAGGSLVFHVFQLPDAADWPKEAV